jgi:hypothetical protein
LEAYTEVKSVSLASGGFPMWTHTHMDTHMDTHTHTIGQSLSLSLSLAVFDLVHIWNQKMNYVAFFN